MNIGGAEYLIGFRQQFGPILFDRFVRPDGEYSFEAFDLGWTFFKGSYAGCKKDSVVRNGVPADVPFNIRFSGRAQKIYKVLCGSKMLSTFFHRPLFGGRCGGCAEKQKQNPSHNQILLSALCGHDARSHKSDGNPVTRRCNRGRVVAPPSSTLPGYKKGHVAEVGAEIFVPQNVITTGLAHQTGFIAPA